MTNLEYVRNLNADELACYVYSTMIPVGNSYNSSRLGLASWLKKEHKPIEVEEGKKKSFLSIFFEDDEDIDILEDDGRP